MMNHKELETLLKSTTEDYTELRQACSNVQMPLSPEMAAALGTPSRRITPFLSTVVDVIASKLEVDNDSIAGSKVADTKSFQRWLSDSTWGVTEKELYAAVVRDGVGYVLVLPSLHYTAISAYNGVNGARLCDGFAFNTWTEGNDNYLDLYYADRIEKYTKSREDRAEWKPRTDSAEEQWPIAWVDNDGTPLGIAIVEFSIGDSDIADAVQISKDLNESLLDMLATSRTQGWPQRYLKGEKNADVLTSALGQPVLSNNGNPIRRTVRTAPGSIMILGATAELSQLPAMSVDTALLDKLLELLSFTTTVSTHYFSGQWPSGVALLQAESRLNHKVEGHQARLSTAIVSMLRLSMRLSNYFAGTRFDAEQPLNIPWHSPEIETEDLKQTRQAFQQDSLVKLVEGGLLSKDAAVRSLHPDWDETQIVAELTKLGITSPADITIQE